MIATHNHHAPNDNLVLSLPKETLLPTHADDANQNKVKNLSLSSQLLLPNRIIAHHPKSGLNPLVDAAGYLFSVVGKLRHIKTYRPLSKLQKDLIQEINTFQETIKAQPYNAEYLIVCRYVLCATLDDVISNTTWGGQGQWDSYNLLSVYNQDTQHHDKFFSIMERAIKEPALYIDLMEFMYICLSLGYKGQYRATEHAQYQLEQITNSLYKHIQAYRGSFSKTLSPMPIKSKTILKTQAKNTHSSIIFIFFVTACVIMTIFVSLGYLMDVISNEAYQNLSQLKNPIVHSTSQ